MMSSIKCKFYLAAASRRLDGMRIPYARPRAGRDAGLGAGHAQGDHATGSSWLFSSQESAFSEQSLLD